MYQNQYAELLEERQDEARERERIALDRSIQLLSAAKEKGLSSREATDAIYFTQRLWTVLLEDLAKPDNELPRELRAQLISIGIWILRECGNLRAETSTSLDDLIMVSEAIRDGVK